MQAEDYGRILMFIGNYQEDSITPYGRKQNGPQNIKILLVGLHSVTITLAIECGSILIHHVIKTSMYEISKLHTIFCQ